MWLLTNAVSTIQHRSIRKHNYNSRPSAVDATNQYGLLITVGGVSCVGGDVSQTLSRLSFRLKHFTATKKNWQNPKTSHPPKNNKTHLFNISSNLAHFTDNFKTDFK